MLQFARFLRCYVRYEKKYGKWRNPERKKKFGKREIGSRKKNRENFGTEGKNEIKNRQHVCGCCVAVFGRWFLLVRGTATLTLPRARRTGITRFETERDNVWACKTTWEHLSRATEVTWSAGPIFAFGNFFLFPLFLLSFIFLLICFRSVRYSLISCESSFRWFIRFVLCINRFLLLRV